MGTTTDWLEVRVRPDATSDHDQRAALVAALVVCGSAGVVEDGGSFVGYVPDSVGAARIRESLTEVDARADIDVAPYHAGDWLERWQEGIRAHDLGALRVAPPWLATADTAARTIVIEPGMAFGTGEHATTRGMLRLLAGVVRAGDLVADLGTGSAVLAIAAAKLGAARVAAIEIDEDAISNAEANVERNLVSDRVGVIAGDAHTILPLVAPVGVITANIVSSAIIDLLPVMRTALAPGGCAIVGGILLEERPRMRDVLRTAGWALGAEDVEDEWWATTATRP